MIRILHGLVMVFAMLFVATSAYLSQIRVNSVPAAVNTNCRIVQYPE